MLVFPILFHVTEKICGRDFNQIFRTIRGGPHLDLQGVVISGINLLPELFTLIKLAKIAIVSGRDIVTG